MQRTRRELEMLNVKNNNQFKCRICLQTSNFSCEKETKKMRSTRYIESTQFIFLNNLITYCYIYIQIRSCQSTICCWNGPNNITQRFTLHTKQKQNKTKYAANGIRTTVQDVCISTKIHSIQTLLCEYI